MQTYGYRVCLFISVGMILVLIPRIVYRCGEIFREGAGV